MIFFTIIGVAVSFLACLAGLFYLLVKVDQWL